MGFSESYADWLTLLADDAPGHNGPPYAGEVDFLGLVG